MTRRAALPALLLASALCSGACLRRPVEHRLDLFLNGPRPVVAVTVSLHAESKGEALVERLDAERRDLLDRRDEWSRRLERLEPVSERIEWDFDEGELGRSRRWARLPDIDAVPRLFADDPLGFTLEERDGEMRLEITRAGGSRATGAEQRRMDAQLALWGRDVAEHVRAVAAVYRYLDEHPDRAHPVLAALLGTRGGDVSEAEEPLVEEAERAMDRLAAFFSVPDDQAISVDELAWRVYDPLPAALRLHLPATPAETEGFLDRGGGVLDVPSRDLAGAVEALEGRWIEPDPFLAVLVAVRSGENGPDVDAFAVRPRRVAGTPSAAEVSRAVEAALTGDVVYRARWSVAPASEELPLDDPSFRLASR